MNLFSIDRLTPPAFDAIESSQLTEWLRLDADDDVATLKMLTASATEMVEHEAGRIIGAAEFIVTFEGTARTIVLPISPVQSVASVTAVHDMGFECVLYPETYEVELHATRSVIRFDTCPYADRVIVRLTAGYSNYDAVPLGIRHAIAVLVEAGYADRGGDGLAIDKAMVTVRRLIAPTRRVTL